MILDTYDIYTKQTNGNKNFMNEKQVNRVVLRHDVERGFAETEGVTKNNVLHTKPSIHQVNAHKNIQRFALCRLI